MTSRSCRRESQRRSGVLTVCTLACLMIAAATMTITVRTALIARHHEKLEHQMVQTEWLLDAGVRRALTRMKIQANYEGETWKPAGALNRFGVATVEIIVSVESPAAATVKVTATIVEPSARASTTRRSHLFNYPKDLPGPSNAE